MAKKNAVDLSEEERELLNELITLGNKRVRETNHAHILLKADAGWTDQAIAEALEVSILTIQRVRHMYEVFPPAQAKGILDRLEFHFAPKHGNWLNMAEIELSVLSRQCLHRYMANQALLFGEVAAWEVDRNNNGATVDWQFTTADARIKLAHLYPRIQL